jgi:phospholipase/carboxylesterase
MSLTFQHRFVLAKGPGQQPLLLLHGTGGDENDLVPLGEMLAPGAALISPRGKVLEHGMPRYFSRLAEGVFDLAEVRQRAGELADFVEAARRAYDLDAPLAVGFSNGANVAAAILTLRPQVLAGAILLRPMAVLDEAPARLDGRRILMLSGTNDPIVPAASAERLAAQFRAAGAEVEHQILPGGHGLTQADVQRAKAWLKDK